MVLEYVTLAPSLWSMLKSEALPYKCFMLARKEDSLVLTKSICVYREH